jgi:CRISPR-associated endonuclease/helicase Cas3
MLLAGLTSFADWIGSNEESFTFGEPEDCDDLPCWFHNRRGTAERALAAIGWGHRIPLSRAPHTFEEVFGRVPRPLQQAMADALPNLDEPAVVLVEAPMGEGKTEAAYYAHLELQRRFGHRGMYIALPTRATGDAMFERTLTFLRDRRMDATLDLQLLHGAKMLNDTFQRLRFSEIDDERPGGEVRAAEWFTHKKRALLSEYGVGTVDQALMPILPVRHNFVRLWGLANRVLVLDEIHAYDAYTGTLLQHLISWLQALGSSILLLSATLYPTIRRGIAKATGSSMPKVEEAYPRLSIFRPGKTVEQRHFEADPARRLTIRLGGISAQPEAIHAVLHEQLVHGGMSLALVNTVQRAQALYRLFPEGAPVLRNGVRVGKRLTNGTQVLLFHARFPAEERREREREVLEAFGPGSRREGRRILIATQVAEQSLDLDFDVIVTDLAPIDLILQRAGRLWRHAGRTRPVADPRLFVAGLDGKEPPSFGKPLWWGKVYREDLLLRTWGLLRERPAITLPDEIDSLVTLVYEEAVDVPGSVQERLARAMTVADGEAIAHRNQANTAIIGFPDDASWNDPSRFLLYDEDAPRVHRTLMAQTRLGEDTVVAIPLLPEDKFQANQAPNAEQSKEMFLRAMSLSRASVVRTLRAQDIPSGWEKSPLLRHCIPLVLDAKGRWIADPSVRLDEELGLLYDSKDAA